MYILKITFLPICKLWTIIKTRFQKFRFSLYIWYLYWTLILSAGVHNLIKVPIKYILFYFLIMLVSFFNYSIFFTVFILSACNFLNVTFCLGYKQMMNFLRYPVCNATYVITIMKVFNEDNVSRICSYRLRDTIIKG